MLDPAADLIEFLERNGVEPWTTDNYGCAVRREDWAGDFVDEIRTAAAEEAGEDAERLVELRTKLDEKPIKTISVARVRAIIDPQ
jgi:hypothetical protein